MESYNDGPRERLNFFRYIMVAIKKHEVKLVKLLHFGSLG